MNLERIHSLFRERRDAFGPMWARLDEVRRAYNGDLVVALPGLSQDERPAIANLVKSGIDQTGRRISSVIPEPCFPAKSASDRSDRAAALKGNIVKGWWHANKMPSKLARRARWLIAYSAAPVSVVPDHDGNPLWVLRDPLNTWPAPRLDPDDMVPPDCIFSYKRSRSWLERAYPDQYRILRKHESTATFTMLEYLDQRQRVVMCVGDESPATGMDIAYSGASEYVTLIDVENKAGVPLTVCPGRPTLDSPQGQFDGMIGIQQMQSQLMALHILAVQRGVFGETWVYSSDPQRPARIINNADARSGKVGNIVGGQLVNIQPQPGVLTAPTLDRMEYAERADGSVPAEFGGFSTSNIRTGRRGSQVLEASVDYIVQEAQTVFEQSLEAEDAIAMQIAKKYQGSRSISLYVPNKGEIQFTPSKDLDSDVHQVKYAYAGADADTLVIAALQRVGAGIMSKRQAMQMDPMTPDVEAAMDEIVAEQVEQAVLTGFQTQLASPTSPYTPLQGARIAMLVRENKKSLGEAIEQVHQEAAAEQAAAAQGQLDAQGQQPGLSAPGAPGTPDAFSPIQDPGAGPGNLSQLMTQIRRPQMMLPQESQPVGAPTQGGPPA